MALGSGVSRPKKSKITNKIRRIIIPKFIGLIWNRVDQEWQNINAIWNQ